MLFSVLPAGRSSYCGGMSIVGNSKSNSLLHPTENLGRQARIGGHNRVNTQLTSGASGSKQGFGWEQYQHVCENAPGMVYQFLLRTDGSMAFPFVSDGCREVCEVEPEAAMRDANLIIETIHLDDRADFYASVMESAQTLSPWKWEGRTVYSSGHVKWVQGASRPTLLANGDILWDGLLIDVTERKLAEQKIAEQREQLEEANRKLTELNLQLESLASVDGLTGIYNRRVFQARLCDEIQRVARFRTPLSLILLDVDHFKSFNDTYGHPCGDEVLRQVAKILKESVREIDIVARYGGEEFAVILPGADRNPSIALAERLRFAIEQARWPLRGITVSIGIATENCAITDCEFISNADKALYQSKANGRNRATHSSLLNLSE